MRIGFWTGSLFVIWMMLTGSLEFSNIIVGLIVSAGIAWVYTKSFEGERIEWINPYWFGVYLMVFFKSLLISNMQISRRILRKDMRISPAIVAVKTTLTSDWKKLLLANSVTLTPGTMTLDVKGDTLFIHTIEYYEENSKEELIREFEAVIAKI